MIVLTGNCSRPKAERLYEGRADLGMLLSPTSWRNPHTPYACDNDVFGAWHRHLTGQTDENPRRWWRREGETKWLKMLDKIPTGRPPMFVLLPDMVGDWEDTIGKAWYYLPELRDRGLSVALALQDGPIHQVLAAAEMLFPHWYFIGGSKAWKWQNAEEITRRARGCFNRKVHIGRAGGTPQVAEAMRLGVDSCDGSMWAAFSNVMMPRLKNTLDNKIPQLRMNLRFQEAL